MKFLLATFLILVGSLPIANAKTVNIPQEHISFDIPDGWSELPKQGMLYAAGDDAKTSEVVILKLDNRENRVIDADYVKGVKEGMTSQADNIRATVEFSSEGPVTLNGVPTYQVQSKMTFPNLRISYQRIYPIAANGHIYALTLQSMDPGMDAEFQSIANSFKFDSSPTLPDPMRATLSYKIGQIIGTLLFLLAAFYFIKWVIRLGGRRKT